jgi:opacity protein-like surface antigen
LKKTLLAAAAGFLAVVAVAVPAWADEQPKQNLWQPAGAADFFQPGYNLTGETNRFHFTLAGVHASFLRVGRFRFPTVGLDFQLRTTRRPASDNILTGHWLATAGASFVLNEADRGLPEDGFHAKAFYALRDDPDPRIGRWGITVGYYFGF